MGPWRLLLLNRDDDGRVHGDSCSWLLVGVRSLGHEVHPDDLASPVFHRVEWMDLGGVG